MGTLLLNQIKKQTSSFLQEKYKIAKITFTDVTEAELLTEEATNNDPWGPDAPTMTKIAEASFDVDDFWRIVDVLHKRFDNIDWKLWRRSYKSLVLLEFLLTHGPEEFVLEFQCDLDTIQELGTFQYLDEKGFNWGNQMQNRSNHLQKLFRGVDDYKKARLKALKITKEIQGFGSSVPTNSPSSSSSASSLSSQYSRTSFGSNSSTTTSTSSSIADYMNNEKNVTSNNENIDSEGLHVWDDAGPIGENGSLIDFDFDEENVRKYGLMNEICSKFGCISPMKKMNGQKIGFRSILDVGRVSKKIYDRRFSLE